MPISMAWDNAEQTIFLIRAEGQWKLDDYYTTFIAATKQISSAGHQVILIIDQTDGNAPPSRFISTGRFSNQHRAPNIKLTIMVGMPAFSRALLNTMMKVSPQIADRVKLVDTLEEAREFAQAAAGS